ncbi:MAG: site-specific integrase [Thermoguttaceae bacterium]|nr:site-specific integrase [Thermoguttaceae bacterium]
MATLETIKIRNGLNIKIHFTRKGTRKKLCLGSKYTVKQAAIIKSHVEDIVAALETGGNVGKATAGFIADMTEDLKARFIACSLLEDSGAGSLAALWDSFEEHAEKMGFKERTTANYQTARKWFFRYFTDEQRDAETVTEKEAEEFRAWLSRQKNKYGTPLAPTSVAGIIKAVKTAFNLAHRARVITASPFEFVKTGSFVNQSRQFEVSGEMISGVLDACPSQGWRALFALWRFGGMRKMEPLLLKWDDILWNAGKIRVHSPKTERYEGHAERYCPLFPEIRRELEDLLELAEPGSVYVLPDEIRERSANGLYNAVIRIIRRAGFTPWSKVIVNMRATRVSELKRAGFSSDQRSAFFGHSEDVSEKHYQISGILVDNADYDRACGFATLPSEKTGQSEKTGIEMGILTT